MGNKSTTQVAVKTDKMCYYPGQTITSSVFINAPKPHLCAKVVLHIEGFEQSEFRLDVGNNDIHNSQSTLIRTYFILNDFHSSQAYLHGQYEYPCTFTLPWTIPGSFKQEKGNYKAKIFYCMKVILVSPKDYKENFQMVQQIIVREQPKQLDQYQMGKITLNPQCLCWKNLGVANVKCYFQKKNYLPNDECVMICEVDNMKSKRDITRVKCEFVKTLTLKSTNGIFKVIKEVINTVEFIGAKKGTGYIGQMAQKTFLPLRYKNTANGIHPSTGGYLVKCEYSINVTPQIGGCFTKGEKTFTVNLQILHPELIQKLQKPQEWRPSVGNVSKIQIV